MWSFRKGQLGHDRIDWTSLPGVTSQGDNGLKKDEEEQHCS
jgi:hypothetical protein